jgi:hypothetical protein
MASKRGNDYYRYRVYSRHNKIIDFCNNTKLDYVYRRGSKFLTKILKFTLTVDISKYDLNNFNKKTCSYEYDLFIKRLKNIDKSVKIARSYEVFTDKAKGFLHVNVVAFFPNNEFEVYIHKSKKHLTAAGDPIYSYRLRTYEDKTKLSDLWRCGFADIRAVEDSNDLIEYCLKYHIKYFSNPYHQKKQFFTLSTLSLFNKRGFSVPDGFVNSILSYSPVGSVRLDKYMHNSPQSELCGDLSPFNYKFLGILDGYFDQDWFFTLADPPPELTMLTHFTTSSYIDVPQIALRDTDDGFRRGSEYNYFVTDNYPITKFTQQTKYTLGGVKVPKRFKRRIAL